jgi:large subunit ribosomal protein L24
MKIKSGDMVVVIAGNDKGKTGQVLRAIPAEGRVIIEGINIRAKHVKGRSNEDGGGIIRSEHPIDASNVKLDSGKKTASKSTKVATSKKVVEKTANKSEAPADSQKPTKVKQDKKKVTSDKTA